MIECRHQDGLKELSFVCKSNVLLNIKNVVVSTSSCRNVGSLDLIVYLASYLCELEFFHKWILRPGLTS